MLAIDKKQSFYKIPIISFLVIGMLLTGYTVVNRDIQKISTSQLYDTAINMKELQLEKVNEIIISEVDSYINSYKESILADLSFIKDNLGETIELFGVEEETQINHHIQLLSQEYYYLEFTIWNQENNQLEAAFLNGDEMSISKDLDSYLSDASLYETYDIDIMNQKIILKVNDLICLEEIKNSVSSQIDNINVESMGFQFVKLEEDINPNSNYFGHYVTNDSNQTKHLYLDDTDLNGKYLLKEMKEGLEKTGKYLGISYHQGSNGEGHYLIHATTYDTLSWVLVGSLSLDELMDGTAQLIDGYEENVQSRLKISETISIFMMVISFISGAILLKYHKSKEVIVEKRRSEMVSLHNKLLLSKQEQMNQFTHDIKNHLIIIKGLIESNQSHKAIGYIDSVYDDLNDLSQMVITGHRLFDIILNDKISDMKKLNITFEKEIEKVSLDFIDNKDLTVILANLLENAIESCTESQRRQIKLQLYTFNQSYLTLKVINSCDNPPVIKNGRLKSQKSQREIHGYGVKIIERAVLKYSGISMWEYDEVNKTFKFTVMIPYTQKS